MTQDKQSAWTPGPLFVSHQPGSVAVTTRQQGGYSYRLADCCYWSLPDKGQPDRVTASANATLYAAAPDLYEAVEDALWALEGIVEDEGLGEKCPRLEGEDLCGARCCEHSGCAVERLDRVRAALAKAKGEHA